jgi:hypothetical protein
MIELTEDGGPIAINRTHISFIRPIHRANQDGVVQPVGCLIGVGDHFYHVKDQYQEILDFLEGSQPEK